MQKESHSGYFEGLLPPQRRTKMHWISSPASKLEISKADSHENRNRELK